jgi:hypothetical protein
MHTPGPWTAEKLNETSRRISYVGPPGMGIGDEVCVLYDQNNEDDARLIAAAPEMLEALIRVCSWMDDNGYDAVDQSFAARAAVRKAIGND